MAQIQIRDIVNRPLIGINVRLALGNGPSDEAYDDKPSDFAGNLAFPNPLPSADGYTLYANVANVDDDYLPTIEHVADLGSDVPMVLDRIPLSRLHVEGHDFIDAFGRRIFLRGITDFLLYKKYLDGEDITPLLIERSGLGANMLRIIGMVSSFSHWFPQEYGQRYYDGLPGFCQILDRFGFYVYFTVFADTEVVMPKQADQVTHFNNVVAQLQQCHNTLGELVNEPYAHQNATANPFAFARPVGVPFSSGSYDDHLGSKVTPPPHWDFHDFHVPRKPIKRIADQCMATNPNFITGMPVISGEPDKFGGPNPFNPKVYLTDPREAAAMAGTARGTACGIVYHTSAGVWSLPFNDVEMNCARAWFGELIP
jgi:hypothetical protein